MNPDGIYPDDSDNRIANLAERCEAEQLEFADVVLMGAMVEDGDPTDGVVVEVIA